MMETLVLISTEMANVLTSLKSVTRTSTAGMEVMSSTAHTPAMCAGLKGNKDLDNEACGQGNF